MPYFTDQTFQNLSPTDFQLGEYSDCTFVGCNISNLNFQGTSFENCRFRDCDLSNAKVFKVSFQQVQFQRCKTLGIQFTTANHFLMEFGFEHCQLDYCNFFKLKLKKTKFFHCNLVEVDFSHAELQEASFEGSNLSGAVFDQSNLDKADFRGAVNYRIDPEENKVKGAKFDLEGLPGLLVKWGIKVGNGQ